MPKKLNLVGELYARLTVLEKGSGYVSPSGKTQNTWICQCECGNTTEVLTTSIRSGGTKSCGCLSSEITKSRLTKHGRTNSKEYRTWKGIKQRCLDPKSDHYSNYGARGITINEKWINNFQAFYDYIGPAPSSSHSIDRIDNDGNYEPGNVRWEVYALTVINGKLI